jgi:hypothetical protein
MASGGSPPAPVTHDLRRPINYGPHLVRVTRQDVQTWMPHVRPAQPLAIDPDPAFQELLDAIRRGGREAYRRLLEVLRELKRLEAGSELFKQALAELSRAQGIVLGNFGVYVDASVDPETLTHSQAALAKALVRHGVVAEAIRGGGGGLPLLRGITAQTIAGVAGEEQVIVYAERVWCLRQLAHTLTDRHGVATHVADGQIKPHEFETLKHRFTSGEFPVLCLSRIGHERHNLQNASCIVNLDLPWLPRPAWSSESGVRPSWRRTRLGADLHPLHPRRRRRAHRLDPLPPRRRAPRRPGLIRRRRRQPVDDRHPARRDHRPSRRRQARRRLPSDRRPPARRRERLRHLTHDPAAGHISPPPHPSQTDERR